MPESELHAVTGAFGYSGRRIAERLLAAGVRVRTLTNSPNRPNPFGDRVEVRPLSFGDPAALAESLKGVLVLHNTYWVRYPAAGALHDEAVENTLALFSAAKAACVGRIVHVSITNPSEDSDLPYFCGKARLERALKESGLPHSILRPALLFGGEDILVNNIAWAIRRFPVLAIFGRGRYRMRPIHVDDLATLAVKEGSETGNRTVDAVGPETFEYREFVRLVARILGKRRLILSLPPTLAWLGTALIGRMVGDILITRDEMKGLMRGLLDVPGEPTGSILLSDWASEHDATLRLRYASELARRRNRSEAYQRQ